MNSVNILGRFTRDMELRYSQGSEPIAILKNCVAVNRRFKKDEADFINIIAFRKTAENINKFFKKGDQIAITGHIQTGSYEKDGHKVYTTEIVVDEFSFVGNNNDKQGSKEKEPDGFYPIDESLEDDDLPF